MIFKGLILNIIKINEKRSSQYKKIRRKHFYWCKWNAKDSNKKKAVCEIKYNDQIGTGFFCEITIKKKPIKVLFTNNHVLDKKAIENENKITLIIDNKKYILKISKDRFKCTNINLDYSCIEILEEDNIDCDTFKIDEEINTDDPTKTYKLEEYAIIQYPEEKLQITRGKLKVFLMKLLPIIFQQKMVHQVLQ